MHVAAVLKSCVLPTLTSLLQVEHQKEKVVELERMLKDRNSTITDQKERVSNASVGCVQCVIEATAGIWLCHMRVDSLGSI